ncbi:MAG: 30S ribosomal protein S4 [Candidatus Marinimicrobia bacterium]|nr:30S ribosomal protein S4 [Candidatus Neomarinimicrobiota bacterium]
MARYTGPVCKLCRREGEKLFLKGSRCLSSKCAIERKGYAPGEHGQGRRRRLSDYGIQLREKQKLRRIYGILEKQFRNYFKKADAMTGVTGTNLLQLLESRLDNTVHRLGFGSSRAAARMLVKHRHIMVNGKTVDIPSFLVSPGDRIQVREKSKKMEAIHDSMQKIKGEHPLPWLELDKAKMEGTFLQVPEREEIGLDVNEQLVVELYSK